MKTASAPNSIYLPYVCCGIAAAFAQSLVDPNSMVPMIGASGAIAGYGRISDFTSARQYYRLVGFFVFSVPLMYLHFWCWVVIGLQFLI